MGFLTTETPLSVTLFNLNATNAAYIYRVRLMRRLKNVHVLRETGNFPVCAKKKKDYELLLCSTARDVHAVNP